MDSIYNPGPNSFLKTNFIHLFLMCWSLLLSGLFFSHGKQGLFSSCSSQVLTVMASLVAEHGLEGMWTSGAWGLSN